MSYGLAQFALSANSAFKNETERLENKKVAAADKLYERGRQTISDLRTQENHQIQLEGKQLEAKENKQLYQSAQDGRDFNKAYNQIQVLTESGDHMGALDVITNTTNSNSNATWNIGVERDENNSPIVTYNEAGEAVYQQNVYDKETGQVLSSSPMTLEDMVGSLSKLNNAYAMSQANAAAEAKRAEKLQEMADKKQGYIDEKTTDLAYNSDLEGIKTQNQDFLNGNKAQRDHIYKIDEMGIKHGYTIDELGVKHGYTIDELGVRHANAVDLTNINSSNRVNEYIGRSDVDAGGTPIVGGGRNDGSVAGIIASLTGTESGGNSGANRTNKDGRQFGGLLQMGDARLVDYARASGTKPVTAMQFKNLSASQQAAVNNWHIKDLTAKAQATGAIGKVINGVPVTLGGLVAVAHLGGTGGMQKFVSTKGKYNPSDELGTSLTDYLRKHASGGVTVARSVPALPKTTGSKGAGNSAKPLTVRDYNANITKGVDTALKGVKSLGIKPDAATTATYARAGTKLKEMGSAKNEREFLDLYQEAFNLVISLVPKPRGKNKAMSKADKNALGHKVLLSMVGASSLGELKKIVYDINPAARGGGGQRMVSQSDGKGVSTRSNPFTSSKGGFESTRARKQQEAEDAFNDVAPNKPAAQSPQGNNQGGKLASLYARGLPAPKTDSNTAKAITELENLSNDMDW